MPRKKWIDKNSAQTFQLLYRSQNDPLLHDETAGERALFQVSRPGDASQSAHTHRELHIVDLEDEVDLESMRENEGEAAEYGIFYDDTKYDYMQHLRDLGNETEQAYFMDAVPVKVVGKGKGKANAMKLEDALRVATLEGSEQHSAVGDSMLEDGLSTFSRTTRPRTYQDQQDVPDEIAGFQPDMDPRLQEVLEALDDDAYVDDKDEEDVFGALTRDGKAGELDLEEFEATFEDDEGWESDATEKALHQPKQLVLPTNIEGHDISGLVDPQATLPDPQAEAASAEDGDWLRDFTKFKRAAKHQTPLKTAESIVAASATQEQAPSLYTLNGSPLRQKKRKGALTNPSAYSMTSSSLSRTEGQQLLDARFDQMEKMYALDEAEELGDEDGAMSIVSGLSKQSKMSALSTTSFADEEAVRKDFGGMMDGFLDDWSKANPGGGKKKGAKGKRGKNGNEIHGLRQLEEVRAELGPAKVRNRAQYA